MVAVVWMLRDRLMGPEILPSAPPRPPVFRVVPASDPQLVVLVMVDEPHPFGGGATVAAPAFQKITQFALQKMEIAP